MSAKAVSCIVGAILINLTFGTFYSIGNISPIIASYMRENGNPQVTTEHGTWLTAAFLLGQGIFIIIGSYIEQMYSSRVACIFGCIIHCASTFLTIWAIDYNFTAVILIYGFGSGSGCGSAYMASIIAAQKWFPTRKGFFTGIIVAGFGFGGLIFTNLQTLYVNPNNVKANSAGYFDRSVYSRTPNLFLYMGFIFTVTQAIGCALAFPPPPVHDPHTQHQSEDTNGLGNTKVVEEPLPDMRSLRSAFKYRIFYIIGIMMVLVAPGVTFVNSLGKRYGQLYISDDRYLTTVLAIAAVANALGRLTWGFLLDKLSFTTCYTMKVLIFGLLIILFPIKFVLSSEGLYLTWMLGLFFGFSGVFVLFPVFIEQVFGSKYHSIVYGILYLFLAMSSSLTSYIIQVTVGPLLADSRKKPDDNLMARLSPCLIIASGYSLSYAIYIFSLPIRRLELAIRKRKDTEAVKTHNTLMQRQDLFPTDRADKTPTASKGEGGLTKENSLGSIVKFADAQADIGNQLKFFGKRPG